MAFLYIAEFAEMQIGPAGRVGQMPMQPPLAEQTVVNTGATTQSAALNTNTRFVRLHTDAICGVAFGTNPTAVAGSGGSMRMAAGQTEYHAVPKGASYKVAVVTAT
jgi:hypothetical protein